MAPVALGWWAGGGPFGSAPRGAGRAPTRHFPLPGGGHARRFPSARPPERVRARHLPSGPCPGGTGTSRPSPPLTRGSVRVVLGVVAIGFAITGVLAWRSLAELPAREEIRAALQAGTGVAPPDGSSGARSGPAAEEALVPEPEQRVRFVDEDGVVSIRPQGQLLRAPSAASRARADPAARPRSRRLPPRHLHRRRDHRRPDKNVAARPRGRAAGKPDVPATGRPGVALAAPVRARRSAASCAAARSSATISTRRRRRRRRGEAVLVRCAVAGTDLAGWLVEQGWATPSENAPEEWAALHETARAEGRGPLRPHGPLTASSRPVALEARRRDPAGPVERPWAGHHDAPSGKADAQGPAGQHHLDVLTENGPSLWPAAATGARSGPAGESRADAALPHPRPHPRRRLDCGKRDVGAPRKTEACRSRRGPTSASGTACASATKKTACGFPTPTQAAGPEGGEVRLREDEAEGIGHRRGDRDLLRGEPGDAHVDGRSTRRPAAPRGGRRALSMSARAGPALAEEEAGHAARRVPARLGGAAVGVGDPHEGVRPAGGLDHHELVEADPVPPVRERNDPLGRAARQHRHARRSPRSRCRDRSSCGRGIIARASGRLRRGRGREAPDRAARRPPGRRRSPRSARDPAAPRGRRSPIPYPAPAGAGCGR